MLTSNVHHPTFCCECLVNGKDSDMTRMLACQEDKKQACIAANLH